jgi:hypothetical protein
MNLKSLKAFLRSPLGRLLAACLGLGIITQLIRHSGIDTVSAALLRTLVYFPWVVLLEGCLATCTILGLRALYGKDAQRVSAKEWFQVGFTGYVVMGLVPAGRAVAEAARAAMLAKKTSSVQATAAGLQLQAVALFSNAVVSLPATLAFFWVLGFSIPTLGIALNFLVTAALGSALLFGAQSAGFSRFLEHTIGRVFPAVKHQLQDFSDQCGTYLREGRAERQKALKFECLGRVFQVIQYGILAFAAGGKLGLIPALCSEGLHLMGAAMGEMIPAQLGATELSYQLSSDLLALSPADALVIPLLAHLAQLFWMGVSVVGASLLGSSPQEVLTQAS